MNNNRILEKIRKKEIANVVSIKSENLDIIEYASKLNYDAIHLDAEHGSFSVDSIENICQLAISCGLTVTARIHKISKQEINLFIDRGVQGIWVHMLIHLKRLNILRIAAYSLLSEKDQGVAEEAPSLASTFS